MWRSRLLLLLATMTRGTLQNSILDWKPASEGQFPYMVSLQRLPATHVCGGTLVTLMHVVTSAVGLYTHYSSDSLREPEEYRVVAGAVDLSDTAQYWRSVAEFRPCPNFLNDRRWTTSVVVVRLKEAFVASPSIAPLSLPNDTPSVVDQCVVIGWNVIDEDDAENILLYATQLPESIGVCDGTAPWNGISSERSISAPIKDGRHFCVIGPKNYGYPREAQIGNTLACDSQLFGVILWLDWIEDNFFEVYIPVARHLRWIRDVIEVEAEESVGGEEKIDDSEEAVAMRRRRLHLYTGRPTSCN